ncbi:solute carrier family 22 member 4 [Elysia marginata]|uniref:Solute carrier family 22 member 4 n=1 Tax=Elysia marginata TaxID=1093978 RepID=A0AAV4H278_9GAST|nr:solute carrier family 22 member 4 [Elysia marginata]
MTETFDAEHRELPTFAMQSFWAVGVMSMALLGYLIPEWQDLELAITLPVNILSVIYIFIIPESLPWLLSKGKLRQAETVINRFTAVNKLEPVPNLHAKLERFSKDNTQSPKEHPAISISEENSLSKPDSQIYTVITLFRTPRLRIITLIMFYLFLVNALAYYGIMYSTPELDGNRFLNLFLLGLVEIPAYIICITANKLIGRRRSVSIFLFICAVCNIAVLFIPEKSVRVVSDFMWGILKLEMIMVIVTSFECVFNYAYQSNVTLGIFGALTLVGCVFVLLLPETHNQPMPQTIEDVEKTQDASPKLTLFSSHTNSSFQ